MRKLFAHIWFGFLAGCAGGTVTALYGHKRFGLAMAGIVVVLITGLAGRELGKQ